MGLRPAGPGAGKASIEQAAALHQAGRLEEAEAHYSLLLKGPVVQRRMALQLLALLQRETGRPADALASYDQLLASGERTADIHLQRSVLLHALGRLPEALESCGRAIKLDPGRPAALNNHGALLEALGRPQEALASLDAALSLRPDYAQALYNRGAALAALARPEAALASYDRALAIEPRNAAAHNNRGLALADLNRHADAIGAYDEALAIAPDNVEALNNRSVALRSVHRLEEALEAADRALAIRPGYVEALNTRGLALAALGRVEAALDSYARALGLRPGYLEALNNAGVALTAAGRFDEAMARFDAALAIDPAFADAQFNAALVLLRTGRFEAGWAGQEARWRRRGQPGPTFPDAALWLGAGEIAGKTVLLHAEQGLGDTLQFCRYAATVAARGARVVLQVQPALKRLMGSLEGVQAITAIGEPPPAFDLHTPLMSLPLALDLPEPWAAGAYLHAQPDEVDRWRARLGAHTKARIGLVWSGNPQHENDRNRSIPFETLAPLLEIDAQFISLQNNTRAADAAALDRTPEVRRVEEDLHDLGDTAALVAACDLVISVDTAVAHLAGALGRPVWILLPHHPDWRWADAGETTPWYPTARLFRQQSAGDWAGVLAAVGTAVNPAHRRS